MNGVDDSGSARDADLEIPAHVSHRIAEEMTKRFGYEVTDHRVEEILRDAQAEDHLTFKPDLHHAVIAEALTYGIGDPS